MLRKSINRRIYSLALLGLLPAGMAFSEATRQTELEKESTNLISRVENVARDLYSNADQLSTLSGQMHIAHGTHHEYLNRMKLQVNDELQPALVRLTEIQPELPGWKQAAVDRMLASARNLASNLNAAIVSKTEAGSMAIPVNSEYRDLIERVSDHAELLVKTSDAAGTYAAAQVKAADAGLEIPEL
jgi:hypothetical protein